MLMEGTSVYFWLLFLIIVLIYITKKISLSFIFKKARIKNLKAYIPIKYKLDLVDALHLNHKIAYMSYIPFYGIKFRLEIIKVLLQGFGLNPKDAIYFILFPMYKYPELAFRNVKLIQNDYSLTEGFIESENILFGKEENNNQEVSEINTTSNENINTKEVDNQSTIKISDDISFNPQMINTLNNQKDSVFTNQNLVPDEHHETYVEAPKEIIKEEKPIITPINEGRPKICPKCGAKLAPGATTCFICGTKLT